MRKEKFSNRMVSANDVKTDLFVVDVRVNKSVWRNLDFLTQQDIINKMSEGIVSMNTALESEYLAMQIREENERTIVETNVGNELNTEIETNSAKAENPVKGKPSA